ncbi:MAG: hypothetical protein U1F58_04610 [Burkholderiales bacterium]
MNLLAHLRSGARMLAATLLVSAALVRPATAADWTDIWWAVPEVGWGVNFVHSDQFIFATFYVHDANLQPEWYTGEMTANADGSVWSGPLYRTTGSYFGAQWQKGQTDTQPVGNVTFTRTSSYTGTLVYNVGAVSVTKQITRLTLTGIRLGAVYKGGFVSYLDRCDNPANNGVARVWVDIAVAQSDTGNLRLDFYSSPDEYGSGKVTCSVAGNSIQDGLLFRIPSATYACGSTFSTTALVTQIKATAQGIEGQWQAPFPGGCVESAYFSAVLY